MHCNNNNLPITQIKLNKPKAQHIVGFINKNNTIQGTTHSKSSVTSPVSSSVTFPFIILFFLRIYLWSVYIKNFTHVLTQHVTYRHLNQFKVPVGLKCFQKRKKKKKVGLKCSIKNSNSLNLKFSSALSSPLQKDVQLSPIFNRLPKTQ